MNKPLVSIICTAYNHEKFIRDCLDGFLIQKTDFPFEVLINDDASTDKTADIIRAYEDKFPDIIKPIYQQENQYTKGDSLWRTILFPRVKGKYIAICEGDDYWTDPQKLQKQVDFLNGAHPGYVMSFHDARLIDEEGNLISKSMFLNKEKKDLSNIDIISGKYMHTSTVMFESKLLNQYMKGSFKGLNGDAILFTMLAHYGGAKYLYDIQSNNYRIHNGGIWSSLKRYDRLRHNIDTRSQLLDIVDPKFKWVVKRYLFVNSIHLTPFCHGLFPRLKQYIQAYKYFDVRYIGRWFSAHNYLLKMVFEKVKSYNRKG